MMSSMAGPNVVADTAHQLMPPTPKDFSTPRHRPMATPNFTANRANSSFMPHLLLPGAMARIFHNQGRGRLRSA